MEMWGNLDSQTQAGIVGQLVGHGLVIGKQVLGGVPITRAVDSNTVFWAAFQIASEYLTGYASRALGTPIAGVAVPAGVQYAALTMYEQGSKRVAQDVMRGNIMSIADSPFLAGTVGSIIAKSYA